MCYFVCDRDHGYRLPCMFPTIARSHNLCNVLSCALELLSFSSSLTHILLIWFCYLTLLCPVLASLRLQLFQKKTEKAIAQLKATIQWREEFGVLDLIGCLVDSSIGGNNDGGTNKQSGDDGDGSRNPTKEELAKIVRLENETGKMYVRGHDKDGRALLYMRPAMENTNNELNNMRHLVYNLERAIACTTKTERNNADGKICLIIDYEGFQMRHAPSMSTSRKTLSILQHHYPERMHRVYLCSPPLLFRTVWAMVKPFVDPVTKEKICFCHGEKGLKQHE